MKSRTQLYLKLTAGAFFTTMLSIVPAQAAEPPAGAATLKSVFVMPANPNEGRDPFFPDSTRPYQSATPTVHVAELTSLKLVGVSGTPEHRMVIINKNTFAEGDEQDVIVPGGRIRVRCLKINPNSVLIEVAGHNHELNFSNNK